MADNECLGNSFGMGTIYWYICGRVCAEILIKDTQNLSNFIGLGYFAKNFIVYCAPILASALISWILFAITKQKIKLNEDNE